MAKATCQTCGMKEDTKLMELLEKVSEAGNKKRFYCHKGECWDSFLKLREETDRENAEKDAMFEVIKELHKMQIIPTTFFSGYLVPTRNGNFKLGKKIVRRKEGYSFLVIKRAYELSKPNIMYARKNVEFKAASDELRYCFSIVIDNLPIALKKMKAEEKQEVMVKEFSEVQTPNNIKHENTEVKYKKKTARDFSHFLDD